MGILLKNGTLITENGKINADILIEENKIAKISESIAEDNHQVLDVLGKYILPGLIDMHVHFRDSGIPDGFEYKEDWLTGSKAAAAGGVTSAIDMPNTKPPTTTKERLDRKREAAKKSIVNYGFYIAATPENYNELASAKNYAGIKVFMGSSTGNLLITDSHTLEKIFQTAKNLNKPVLIHAEDEELLNQFAKEAKEKGTQNPKHSTDVRKPIAEHKAIENAIELAKKTKCILHILHVSTKESVELIRKAKKSGMKQLSAETCPHYLFLTEDFQQKQGNFGKMNPPLRQKEDVEALWAGLKDGTLDIISTDHAPHLKEEKEKLYWEAPSGVPGIQTMLPLLLHAVDENKISLEDIARLVAAAPARLLKIKGKGEIKEGMDADLVLVDLEREREILDEEMLSKCKWSPYSGMKIKGWPLTTIANGKVIYDNGKVYEVPAKELVFGD